ncbi:FtsK/SpoIIIE domain-containing protein [Demequina aurantiaca]|uniref:FHA domain-containing protein n=1 Tax=Demequina aurantiaca TaxID=676200 RepID=UPI003D33BAE8
MRVTWDDRLDLDLTAAATCADLVSYLAQNDRRADEVWCGAVRLDPDHRAGVEPLVHGALLRPSRGAPAVRLSHPHLAVTCGPDAGGLAPLTRSGITVGRGEICDLRLADDAVSQFHARAGYDTAPWVRDGGSRNGTILIREGGTRRRSRRARPLPGEHLVMGDSVLQVRPMPADKGTDSGRRSPVSGPQLSAMGAGAISGIGLAVVTGRWYFALLALVFPLISLAPLVARRLRGTGASADDLAPPADPCPLATAGTAEDRRLSVHELAGPVAVVGEPARATATARGIVLAQRLRPQDDSWSEPWMRWLPRANADRTVLLVPQGLGAPSWAATVVEANATNTYVHQGTSTRIAPRCWVGEDTADALARLIAGTRSAEELIGDVAWADLEPDAVETPGRTVATPIGLSAGGRFVLDLARHGPHVLVAGTTGSGKSALLETLVLGLAHRLSPADLTIALIDFKGGAGLRHCMDLPHVVGCLTDLDGHLAERALVALSAELEQRKRAVAQAGHGSLAEWEAAGGAPPRLLVVADEYQEIAQHHRAFLPHLARLAAQGRSLGLHLVLATQRPAGAVTPEIRANVTTTVALRVASAAESQDLLGSADAALLPVDRPGRAIVAHGAQHLTVQIAQPTVTATAPVRPAGQRIEPEPRALAAAAAARWEGVASPPRLWRDPLPASVPLPRAAVATAEVADLTAPLAAAAGVPRGDPPAFLLGLADWPAERRQGYTAWRPTDGPLAIVGVHGSGRTTALETLGEQSGAQGLNVVWLPPDPREAARTIDLCQDRADTLLLIDDAGGAAAALAERDRGAPADALLRRLSRGLPTVIALAPHDPARLAAAATTRVILAGMDPGDQSVWNVPRALTSGSPTAGRGWLGSRGQWCELQLFRGTVGALRPESLVAPLPPGEVVRRLCEAEPGLLAIGGDNARRLYCEGGVTLVGAPSRLRDDALAQLKRLVGVGAVGPHAAEVAVRDELVSFPGSPRPQGTVVLLQPTERNVRDACGAGHIGLTDDAPPPGRVVVVQDSGVWAAQLPFGTD